VGKGRLGGAETGHENLLRIVALNPRWAVFFCVLAWLVARLAVPAFRWIRVPLVVLSSRCGEAAGGGRGYPGGRGRGWMAQAGDCRDRACANERGSSLDSLQRIPKLFTAPDEGAVACRARASLATFGGNDSMFAMNTVANALGGFRLTGRDVAVRCGIPTLGLPAASIE